MTSIIYTANCLTISEGENVKIINSDNADYKNLVAYYKAGDFTALYQYLNGFKDCVEDVYKKNGITVKENVIFINGEQLPKGLGKKILALAEDKKPIERFIKFWNKLKENPSYWAVESAYVFLDKNNLPIMEDGNIIGYKAVREDWFDKYSAQISNKVGETVKLDRRLVDDDRMKDCSYGFHVGSKSYVSSFGYQDKDHVVEVVVNPKNIVSVPSEGAANKIRVCEYFIKQELPWEEFMNLEPEIYYDDDDDEIEEDDFDDEDDFDLEDEDDEELDDEDY